MKNAFWLLITTVVLAIVSLIFVPSLHWRLHSILVSWGLSHQTLYENAPIKFFGLVVDQNGHPVTDAEIDAQCNISDGFFHQHFVELHLKSDGNGKFRVIGAYGMQLTISKVSKTRYFQCDGGVYDYSPPFGSSGKYIPDSRNPTKFLLWKQRGPERLVWCLVSKMIVPDGRVYTVDLMHASVIPGRSPNGDLYMSVTRPKTISPYGPFDWSYVIEVNRGGLIVTSDPLLYLAPEGGYQPRYEFISKATNQPPPDPRKKFYIKCREGHIYANFSLGVYPRMQSDGAELLFESYANPRGSRNLEPDLEKDVLLR
jgi:hypothetical protein